MSISVERLRKRVARLGGYIDSGGSGCGGLTTLALEPPAGGSVGYHHPRIGIWHHRDNRGTTPTTGDADEKTAE